MKRIMSLSFAILLILSGCQRTEDASASIFAMDTVMTVTAYGNGAAEAVKAATEEIRRLELLLSVTLETSDIAKINASDGSGTVVDEETAQLLERALGVYNETGGAYSPALYRVLRAWGFTTGDYRIPEDDELAELVALTWAGDISVSGRTVTVPEDVELDLGGIAKGYVGDVLAELMADMGIESAIFDLGGDVRTVGCNSEGKPWRVALKDPYGEEYLGILEVEDVAVITSGSYERYFEGEDGTIYHHILDPETGKPAESGLVSVTVVTPDGARGDALATALFVMGLEKGAEFVENDPELEAVFLTTDGALYLTGGLEGIFTPESGYEINWI